MYFSCGSGCFVIEGKKYPIKKGTLIYIKPDIPYAIEADAKAPFDCWTVHFSFTGVGFIDGKWEIWQGPAILSRHHVRDLKNAYSVEEQFQKLVDCWYEKLPGYEFIAKTMLQQLLILIEQNIKRASDNYATSLKVERTIQYMHENIERKITLAELSDLVQMSQAYLSKTFKEATGYTVIEYFNKLKIDRAKELLIEGSRRIKEVSEELGFVDEFYFSRVFKKVEGVSPSEFCSRIIHVF
jgi:AraC-like DNA-binding protein